jgi:hypothetical protein
MMVISEYLYDPDKVLDHDAQVAFKRPCPSDFSVRP